MVTIIFNKPINKYINDTFSPFYFHRINKKNKLSKYHNFLFISLVVESIAFRVLAIL